MSARVIDHQTGEIEGTGRALTAGEVLACKAAAGMRDAALIGMLYFGLRRAEVVALSLTDYQREKGALFTRIRRWDTLTVDRLTTQAVYTILKERAAQAGVADFSPHDFRRTFVGELLERGADIATVAKLAGHANVKTTAGYDRRGEESKKKAAELLHYPF